jgi:hypothetical protein
MFVLHSGYLDGAAEDLLNVLCLLVGAEVELVRHVRCQQLQLTPRKAEDDHGVEPPLLDHL